MYGLVTRKCVPFIYQLDDITRLNFKIDTLSAVSFGIFAGIFYPFFSVTAVRLGATGFLLSIITAAPFMGQLFAVYWGHRSDQGQKLAYVVYSGILARVMILILALTRNVELFALFVVLHFILAAAGWPAYTGLLKKIYPLQYRGQLMGRVQFVAGIIRVFVTFYGGIWLDSHGYRGLFIISGIAGIICSLIYSRIEEPGESRPVEKRFFSFRETFGIIKRDRMLAIVLTGFFIFDTGNLMLAPIYPLIRVKYLDLTNFEIGRLAIFLILGWFITAPLWGRVVDYYQPVRAVLISIFLFIWSPLIYYFQCSYLLLMLASFLQGAAGSSLEVGWLNMMMKMGEEKSSRYSGLYLTVLGFRGILGPVLANVLMIYLTPHSIFLVAIILLLTGIFPFLIYIKNLKNPEQLQPSL